MKAEDLVLAEVVYKNNGDSTKDEKEVGHWGNREDDKEKKTTPKDVTEKLWE